MALTRKQIKSAAMTLDATEREALAEELLLSIERTDRDAIDQAWLAEIRRRDARYRSGKTKAKPVAQVLDRLKRANGK